MTPPFAFTWQKGSLTNRLPAWHDYGHGVIESDRMAEVEPDQSTLLPASFKGRAWAEEI
jgi:hypothetical protein